MDNSLTPQVPASYAPAPLGVAAAWAGAGAGVVWAALTDDAGGRLLGLAAGVLLGVIALFGTLARPRLAADGSGVRLGRLSGARHVEWAHVRRVEVVESRRLGRRVGVLELDIADEGGEHLVVLTTLDLDADPVDVAAALTALRFR